MSVQDTMGASESMNAQMDGITYTHLDGYQEFHIHPGNIFSAVYFLQVPDGAPGITFKRPGFGGMMPPKDIQVESPWHQEFMVAPPKEGTVVIFRSDLYHSVPPLTFDGERVTIALNFA